MMRHAIAVVLLTAFVPTLALAAQAPRSYASFLGESSVTTVRATGIDQTTFGPSAIAIDRASNRTFVADATGRRIWSIDSSGSASVYAGTPADRHDFLTYRDGAVKAARFNEPSGIVIRSDGGVYVADAANFCIRLISHGVVTTIAGAPHTRGSTDGIGSAALFAEPRGLALSKDGTLYVADGDNGVRKIVGSTVSTLPLGHENSSHATGVSLFEESDPKRPTWIFYATPEGFGRFNSINMKTEGFDRLAAVAGIVALAPERVLVTVPKRNTAYFISLGMITRAVAGADTLEGGSGDRDGFAADARFNEPLALAQAADGSFLLADAANHAIRRIPALNLRWVVTDPTDVPPLNIPDVYHIVYISNSLAYYNTMWGDSIEGRIESYMNAHASETKIGKPVRVDGVRLGGSSLEAQGEYIRELLAEGDIDLVIWNLDALMFTPKGSTDYAELPDVTAERKAAWSAEIAKTHDALVAHATHLLLVDQPMSMLIGPGEGYGFKEYFASIDPLAEGVALRSADHGYDFYMGIEQIMEALPIDSIPTYARYLQYERGAHLPLFGTLDFHQSPLGNTFHAEIIERALLEKQPWTTKP